MYVILIIILYTLYFFNVHDDIQGASKPAQKTIFRKKTIYAGNAII